MVDRRLIKTINTYEEILSCTNKGENGCRGGQLPCTACLAKYDQVSEFSLTYFNELLGDERLICNYYNFVLKAHAVMHSFYGDEDDTHD